jgi:hypothetical protein
MPSEKWHLLDCIEQNTKITSPTIQNISTSSGIKDATVECMAACQSSNVCKYWTLDVQNQLCQLKETNVNKSSSVTAVSGEKFCGFGFRDGVTCTTKSRVFKCYGAACVASISITNEKFCATRFSVQILEGDYSGVDEYVEVYINGAYMRKCDPSSDR